MNDNKEAQFSDSTRDRSPLDIDARMMHMKAMRERCPALLPIVPVAVGVCCTMTTLLKQLRIQKISAMMARPDMAKLYHP